MRRKTSKYLLWKGFAAFCTCPFFSLPKSWNGGKLSRFFVNYKAKFLKSCLCPFWPSRLFWETRLLFHVELLPLQARSPNMFHVEQAFRPKPLPIQFPARLSPPAT